jgi:hypothetical protein
MKTLSITPKQGIKATSHRKENAFNNEYAIIAFDNGEFLNPITLRTYGKGSTYYACLWVYDNNKGFSATGSGSAGGGGYHKESAAASEAISKAGIELDKSIAGRGDTAIVDALKSIAAFMGFKNYTLHKAHA